MDTHTSVENAGSKERFVFFFLVSMRMVYVLNFAYHIKIYALVKVYFKDTGESKNAYHVSIKYDS